MLKDRNTYMSHSSHSSIYNIGINIVKMSVHSKGNFYNKPSLNLCLPILQCLWYCDVTRFQMIVFNFIFLLLYVNKAGTIFRSCLGRMLIQTLKGALLHKRQTCNICQRELIHFFPNRINKSVHE